MAESPEPQAAKGAAGTEKPEAVEPESASAEPSGDTPILPEAAGEEEAPIPLSDMPELGEQDSIDEFAQSVVSGLAQAGLDLDGEVEFSEKAAAEILELPVTGDAYFDGWGEFTSGAPDEPGGDKSAPSAPGKETLLQLRLSEEVAADEAGAEGLEAEISLKHDELADAVQSALASVYGDRFSQPRPQPAEALPGLRAAGPRWNGVVPSSDGRSPQDVIYNYFDYEPEGVAPAEAEANGVSAFPSMTRGQRWSPSAPYETNGVEAPFARHDEPVNASYRDRLPVLAGTQPAYGRAHSPERESGRLLGAAAIGLIGGIAIAATLAVFLISNSYGPDKNPILGTASPKAGAEPGYGLAPATAPAEPPSETVAADLTATPGQPAPLAISVRSPRPFEQTLVSITGVPRGARLNAGVDAGNGNWLLPPRRLAGLTVTLPQGTPDRIPLEVQLLDSNARTSLSEKSRFVIRVNAPGDESAPAKAEKPAVAPAPMEPPAQQLPAFNTLAVAEPVPASNPPAAVPSSLLPQPQLQPAAPARQEPAPAAATAEAAAPAQPEAAAPAPFQTSVAPAPAARSATLQAAPAHRPMPSPEVEDLIREGNKRMREGDILEARRYYLKAVAFGDPEAALAMGRSYDPIYFARIERKNGEPDAAKAFDWYRKAMDGGAVQTAKVRIENLKHYLNE